MKFELPKYNSRAVFVGQTGCGKTTLAKGILKYYKHVIVLDAKGLMSPKEWQGYKVVTKFNDLLESKENKLIYQPCIEENNQEFYEKAFRFVYLRKNTVVYIDEVYGICPNSRDLGYWYKAVLTRGRERGVGCFSATQRPKEIPNTILSEGGYFYIFRLLLPDDREKVEKMTGVNREAQSLLGDFEFYFATNKKYSLQKRKLKL